MRFKIEAFWRLLGTASVGLYLLIPAGSVCAVQVSDVRLREPDTFVTPPNGAVEPLVRVRDLGAVEARDAALLLSGHSGGNLSGVVFWCAEAEPEGEDRTTVHLYVELAGKSLLEQSSTGSVPLVIAAYAIDNQGAVIGSFANAVLLEGNDLGEALISGGLRFVGRLILPPGAFSLRTLARVHRTEQFLLARKDLRVRSVGENGPEMSAPLFTIPKGAWLEVRQAGLPTGSERVYGVMPSAKPVLDPTRPTRLVMAASGWPAGTQLQALIADSGGRLLEQPELSINGQMPDGGEETEVIEIEMRPFDVPPGEARLTLRVLSDTFETVLNRDLAVVLAPGEDSAIWPAFCEQTERLPLPTQVIQTEGVPGRRQIRSAYVAALRLLASGNEMEARRAVAELERRVFATDPEEGLAKLRAAELRVVVRLEDEDPRCLPSLLVLHRELCGTYAAYGENVLARHSAIVTAKLAELVGLHKEKPANQDPAEAALVSVAMDLVQSMDFVAGGRLLERALELDSKSVSALENLAALRERTGHRDEATKLLRELVQLDPENSEAHLRLGVNLRRIGRLGSAKEALSSLVEGSRPEWIRVIAAQELVHLLVTEGAFDRAEDLLLRTIDGVGDQQALTIQLAWTRDLTGRVSEASTTLQRVERNVGRREDSARRQYCRWPDLGAHGVHFVLRRTAEERTVDLRRALTLGGLL
jgi:Tfp pilus assembly protein PilF